MNREMRRAPAARGDENCGDADDGMTPGLCVLRETNLTWGGKGEEGTVVR